MVEESVYDSFFLGLLLLGTLYVAGLFQMCRDTGRNNYFVWCRWGRVGEQGATAELGPFSDEDGASTAFAKKFRDKTGNKWAVR